MSYLFRHRFEGDTRQENDVAMSSAREYLEKNPMAKHFPSSEESAMAQEKQTKKQKSASKPIRMHVSFRENGDPEGMRLEDFLAQAPKGTKIIIGNKTIVKK